MPPEDSPWRRVLDGLRRGDEQIAADFYGQYGPLLERLAGRHLEAAMQRRFGADEVAHSVCRTFMRRMQGGEFEFDSEDRVWHLLCAITLAKTRKKAGFHLADKRGIRREESSQVDTDGPDRAPVAGGPGPDEVAEFADELGHLLATLDEEERRIVCLKLERRTHAEIATAVGSSERTVRRLLKQIEQRLIDSSE